MNEMQTSKSVLAKLLSSENLTIEHGNYNTAAFDVKNRVLYLPVFKYMNGDVYDLMVLHEVGHALFTPENGFHSSSHDMGPGFKSYLNVCEDARIEKKIKRKYPGGVRPMTQGYQKLMQENFFGTAHINVNKLNLIDRINLHTKGGASQMIEFSEVEQGFLKRVEDSNTFEEVEEIARAIYEYSKENESETDFHDDSMYDDYELSDEEVFSDPDDNDQEIEMDGDGGEYDNADDDVETSTDSNDDNSSEQTESKNQSDSERTTSSNEGGFGSKNQNPTSHTDNNWQENSHKLNEDNTKPYLYINVPKANLNNIIVDYKFLYKKIDNFYTNLDKKELPYYYKKINSSYKDYFYNNAKKELSNFRKKNNKIVDYLVKEFEMRKKADEYKRTTVSKTGLLDMTNVHAYQYSDNLFKRVATVTSGKNHGLIMFIDWSGSMSKNLAGTIEQLLNLITFCRKVNIPFQVFSFTDHICKKDFVEKDDQYIENYWAYEQVDGLFSKNAKDYNQNYRFALFELFSSKMSTFELNKACEFMMLMRSYLIGHDRYSYSTDTYTPYIPNFMQLSGTPLNQSIIASLEIVSKFKNDNKTQIINTVFLTDGDSHTRDSYYKENGEVFGYSVNYYNVFLVDPVTKKSYRVGKRQVYTDVLYEILRDRTKVNVMGFYLLGQRQFKSFSLDIAVNNNVDRDIINKTFRDKKVYVAKKYKGYDELYYIKDGNDLSVDNDEFVVKEDATKTQIATAFKKFNRDKIGSRIVMKSFAELIS